MMINGTIEIIQAMVNVEKLGVRIHNASMAPVWHFPPVTMMPVFNLV